MAKRAMLSYFSTFKITQLNGAINNSVTSITLDSTEGIRVGQILLFYDGSNGEEVTVSSITSATVIVVTRNASPQAHDDNAVVSHAAVWNNIYIKGSSSISAIISLEIIDAEGVPTVANLVLDNQSDDPYASSAASAKGSLTDLFDNFLPIRVIDPETGFILFHGTVYDADEKYDMAYGMTLRLECKDSLEELRNSPTDGSASISIDTSEVMDRSITATHAGLLIGRGREVYQPSVSSRGGLIRSFINLFSRNIVTHGTADEIIGTFAEDLDDSETAIDVTSAANLCVGNVIYASTEDMLITGISSNTLTVTREVNSTTAITHDEDDGYTVRDSRYTESVKKFNTASGLINLGEENQKSALAHIVDAASGEPQQSTALNAAGEKVYGYSYYVEPNFTSSLATHYPSGEFFNYFVRGSRPSTTPLTYGLRVEQPSAGGFTPTGQLMPMISSDFDRAKNELYTDVVVKYSATRVNDDGAQITNEHNIRFELISVKAVANAENFIWQGRTLHGGTDRITYFDPIPHTAYNPEVLMAKNRKSFLNMGGGCDASETKLIFDNATGFNTSAKGNDMDGNLYLIYIQIDDEIMRVSANNPDGDNANELTVIRAQLGTSGVEHDDDATVYNFVDIATMQYISKTSSVSDGSPAQVLISATEASIYTIVAGTSGGGTYLTNSTYFAEDEVLRGKTNPASTFTIKSRPNNKMRVSKTLKLTVGANGADPDSMREQVASALIRASNDTVRGTLTTYEKPFFYIDNNVGTLASSGGVDTITTSNDTVNDTSAALILSNYGFRTGMLVNELTAAGGTPTGTYGYAVNAGTTQLQVSNWFDGGSISASSELRYYIPVRSGDLIYVKNNLTNVAGNYGVVKVHYAEQNGVSQTTYEIVSSGTAASPKGGGLKTSTLSTTSDATNTTINIPTKATGPVSASFGTLRISSGLVFTSTSNTLVSWTGGHIITGLSAVSLITSGTTATTMISNANGNTSQATDGTAADLAQNVDYLLFWDAKGGDGSGTAIQTIRAAAYKNVATIDTILIAHVKNYGSTQADCEITVFPYQHGIATKGRADYKLSDPGVMSDIASGASLSISNDEMLIWHSSANSWKHISVSDLHDEYPRNLVIPNGGTIGSASDADSIAIASSGVVTMNQIPEFSAGIDVSGGSIAGTLSTAAQGNITSLGTLTTLTVDSIIINGTNIGHTSDTDAIAISSSGVVTMNQIPVFSAGINVSGGTIAGTLATASQGNITTVGALDGGSITSGFGGINVGSATITTSGTVHGDSLTGGTLITSGNVTVGGELSKDSGTFLIDHPVHEDKKLQHGFIEGPKYDLLYRGRATLVNGVATVDINIASNMSAGTFEALTQDPEVWVQNITGWVSVRGSVSGATLTIEAATNSSDTVAWLVMAERADSVILESETTDDEGHLIPESEKPPEKEEKN